jgi:hypothetical protein
MDNQPKQEPFLQSAGRTLKGVLWVLAGLFAVGFCFVGYDELDRDGHVAHRLTADVYMTNDWLVGEHRTCTLLFKEYDTNGTPIGGIYGLSCLPDMRTNIPPHNISVTFWGPMRGVDMNGNKRPLPVNWTCTRDSDGFSCDMLK